MSITSELTDRLKRHYIKPGVPLPGGIFVPEVGLNSNGQQRRCDGVYVGFTSLSGKLLIGHEVKVSRADWRHELDQPEKSAVWAEQCHAWYVVALSTSVVPKEEVPPGWGLMVPNTRSKNRMDIVVKADHKPATHTPSWMVVRSILARLDTLQQQERGSMRHQEQEKARVDAEKRFVDRAAVADPGRGDRELVDLLNQELGIDLRYRDYNKVCSELVEALKVARGRRELVQRYGGLGDHARSLRESADRLDATLALLQQPDPEPAVADA